MGAPRAQGGPKPEVSTQRRLKAAGSLAVGPWHTIPLLGGLPFLVPMGPPKSGTLILWVCYGATSMACWGALLLWDPDSLGMDSGAAGKEGRERDVQTYIIYIYIFNICICMYIYTPIHICIHLYRERRTYIYACMYVYMYI